MEDPPPYSDKSAINQGYQQPGYPPQQQPGYPPQQQPGYPPQQQPGYPPQQQPGYPPQQQPGYPPQQAPYQGGAYTQQPPQPYYAPPMQQQQQQQSNTTVVVTGQPQVTAIQIPYVNDHMCLSIFTTLFCCFILGIIAIIKSSEARNLYVAGNYQGALAAANMSRNLSIAAISCGIAIYVIVIIIQVAVVSASSTTY